MRTSLISGLGLGPEETEETAGLRLGTSMADVHETPVPALSKLIMRLPRRASTAPYPYGYPSGMEGEEIEHSSSNSRASSEARLASLVGKLEIRQPSVRSASHDQMEGEYRMPWFD